MSCRRKNSFTMGSSRWQWEHSKSETSTTVTRPGSRCLWTENRNGRRLGNQHPKNWHEAHQGRASTMRLPNTSLARADGVDHRAKDIIAMTDRGDIRDEAQRAYLGCKTAN